MDIDLLYSVQIIPFCQYCKNILPEGVRCHAERCHMNRVNRFVSLGIAYIYSLSNRHQRHNRLTLRCQMNMVLIRKEIQGFRCLFHAFHRHYKFIQGNQTIMHRLP